MTASRKIHDALLTSLTWALFLSLCAGDTATVAAQEKTEKSIEEKTIPSGDGWPLRFTYYRSSEGKNGAVVVLLHGKSESRLVWTTPKVGFAEELQRLGYAVIALDLRKHGQSKLGDVDADDAAKKDKSTTKKAAGGTELKISDYQAMVADMEAVKKFIFEEHQSGSLNMRKTAVVAPAMSAAVALAFTVNDWAKKPFDDASTPAARTPRGQDVQALVLLSPETSLPGVPAFQVVPALKATPLAALVIVGKGDPLDKDQAQKLFQQLGGEVPKSTSGTKKADPKKTAKEKEADANKADKQRLYFAEPNTKLRGTDLTGKKLLVGATTTVEDAILGFLSEHLQKLDGPFYEWRDRKSPLQN